MAGLGKFVQRAFYLGVGLAAYAGEKAGAQMGELRAQLQKLADEMVERGELTTEEARRLLDDLMQQAQQQRAERSPQDPTPSAQPRQIEILEADTPDEVDRLQQQIQSLQAELRRLQGQ
jgi:polyhydroxyalkanoate synthesis regulator phasin